MGGENAGDGDGDGDGMGGIPAVGECSRRADCDDDDACTDDVCIDATCRNEPIESPACENGTCLLDAFAGRSAVGCFETATGEDFEVCHTTTCTEGGAVGCTVNVALGTPSVTSEFYDDGSRTVIYAIPIREYSVSGDVVYDGSNCLLSTEVRENNPPTVTVAVQSAAPDTCGDDDEVISRSVNVDVHPLLFHFEEGDGVSSACGALEEDLADVDGDNYQAFEADFEGFVLDALGDLDALVGVGTACGSCSETCEGLSCSSPLGVD